MRLPWALAALATLHCVAAKPARRTYNTHTYYVIEIDPRAGASLDDCAEALGVEVVERAGELENHWLVRRSKLAAERRSTDEDPVLRAFERLQSRSDSSFWTRSTTHIDRRVSRTVKYLERQELRQRIKRDDRFIRDPAPPPPQATTPYNASSLSEVSSRFGISDPEFKQQWHLVNEEYGEHQMNVTGLWNLGDIGEGVTSALVDDGLDFSSKDLEAAFDKEASWDFNDHGALPIPTLPEDHHGTRCAGQIAAAKNNVCGVGIAHGSKVAGIRILSGPISDIDEAAALNFGFQNSSIYSCSWGPADDGRSMEAPGYLVEKAVVNGINNGRGGKGSVFVFASGNGAGWGDQCNFDGYTNSIYSITVAAIDYQDLHPPYSEACAANMVVAYSSGSGKHITTTDVGKDKCNSYHGGTSAAAPNAVGVFALALAVRPELTWRDMQHLSVRTAVHINPNDPDWEKTASGRAFSYKYGYGRLDGYRYVQAARDWPLVKPQAWLEIAPVQVEGGKMSVSGETSGGTKLTREGVTNVVEITADALKGANLETLEHVTVRVWATHHKRGDVEVDITSPNGIKSVLSAPRSRDDAKSGYQGWRFSTVKHWDENPVGNWTIRVKDQGAADSTGSFLGWSISLWGGAIDASKAFKLEVKATDPSLPPLHPDDAANHPVISSSTEAAATATKAPSKPTDHLPTDHGHATGEAEHPAFTTTKTTSSSSASTSPSSTATLDPEELGWFSDLGDLVGHQQWVFAAGGAVLIFAIGATVFFCRRRRSARRRHAEYAAITGGDDVALGIVERGAGGGPRTKELYDAFGEVSDDEDADEETGLRTGRPGDSPQGLGFHSGFLDDDEAPSATIYRDEPTTEQRARELQEKQARERPASPASASGSGSGSGDWEHASQTR